MGDVREWTSVLCLGLGLNPHQVDHDLIVDLAHNTDRAVARSAGPVTTYLIGMAVAQGSTLAAAAARSEELRLHWPRLDWRD